jgi:hypothetical protein
MAKSLITSAVLIILNKIYGKIFKIKNFSFCYISTVYSAILQKNEELSVPMS